MSNAQLTQSPENKEGRGTASKVRLAIWVGIITAMLVIVGVVVFANTYDPQEGASPAPSQSQSSSALVAPANVTPDGGVIVSSPATKTGVKQVLVYIDFICPACQQFEKEDGAKLQEMATAGDITLEYRPIAILDRASTSKYSSRALNSFGCVADSNPELAVPFINKLMEAQPKEGTAGLTNKELAEHAKSVGADGVEQCVTEGGFSSWTQTTTKKALSYGLDHTPYVVVDDVLWDNRSDLFAMING